METEQEKFTDLSSHKFKHLFKGIYDQNKDDRFCFILGAGASKTSGIPTGVELAIKWFSEIKERADSEDEFKNWVKANKIVESNIPAYYPQIYKERFQHHASEGVSELNHLLDRSTLSFGYSVLSQLIADESRAHNVIITTNFDNLVEEALYTYSRKRPIVCGHESLASYAIPSIERPLIIKIHRDGLLGALNKPDEIKKIKDAWVNVLNEIFRRFIPIVIGYGGNDGSLMGYLKEVNKCSNFFWCTIKNTQVSKDVEEVLNHHNGKLVAIDGFDELMFDLHGQLGLPILTKTIKDSADKKSSSYENQMKNIREKKEELKDKESKVAVKEFDSKFEKKEWLHWHFKAQEESDLYKKIEIYKKGLIEIPNNINLIQQIIGIYLYETGDYIEAEKYIKLALEIDPNNAEFNGAYATLLFKMKKNDDDAEKYYLKAIKLNPKAGWNFGNYAAFLAIVRKNYKEAEETYKKALEMDPSSIHRNANYAGFLLSQGRKQEAKQYINKAFELDEKDLIKTNLWFYRLAHSPEFYDEAKSELKKLIKNGKRDFGWDYNLNIERAEKDGHPDIPLLKLIAKILTEDYPSDELFKDDKK